MDYRGSSDMLVTWSISTIGPLELMAFVMWSLMDREGDTVVSILNMISDLRYFSVALRCILL